MTCDAVRDLAPAYVLGALERDEEARVRDHLATCREPHPEIEELGGVVPYLAETLEPVEPPSRLKARILAAAADDLRRGEALVPEAGPGPIPAAIPFPGPAERAARREARSPGRSWLLGLAAVLAIVALGGWNVVLQSRLGVAERYEAGVATVLDLATREGSLTAVLAPTAGEGPSGIAAVAADGSVAMAVRGLAPTTGSEVYEAWVIVGDAPTPIGGFQVGADGIATFSASGTPAGEGVVLALTREPAPGATVPTTPPVTAGVAAAPPS